MHFLAQWCMLALAVLLCGQGCSSADAPHNATTLLENARSAWLTGDYRQAGTLYQQYLADFPQAPERVEAWKRLADIEQNVKGNPQAAARYPEDALLEFAGQQDLKISLTALTAAAWFHAKKYQNAIKYYNVLLDIDTLSVQQRVAYSIGLSDSLVGLQEYDEAISPLLQCIQHDTTGNETASCSLKLASLYFDRHKADAARELLQHIVTNTQIESQYRAEAGLALGEDAEARTDRKAAIFWYEAIREFYPNLAVIDKKLAYLRN